MKNILVIVDFQKDFYDSENGTLYVPGAEKCIVPICEKIKSDDVDEILLTVDWHTLQDLSFKENGGIWNNHCVQFSEGASIHPQIMDAIRETKKPYSVFVKGNCYNHEEYGAFENISNYGLSVVFQNYLKDSNVLFKQPIENLNFIVCGLAGDYCCIATYNNILKATPNVTPFIEGMAFIDGEKTSLYDPKCE